MRCSPRTKRNRYKLARERGLQTGHMQSIMEDRAAVSNRLKCRRALLRAKRREAIRSLRRTTRLRRINAHGVGSFQCWVFCVGFFAQPSSNTRSTRKNLQTF